MKQIFSWTLVILQFGLVIVLIANMSLDIDCWLCIIFYIVSFGLGIWAVIVMKIGNFNIVPDVKPNSILITESPYKYIRHPMYTSVIVVGFGMMLSAYSSFTLLIWLMSTLHHLTINLKFRLQLNQITGQRTRQRSRGKLLTF